MHTSGLRSLVPPNQAATKPLGVSAMVEAWLSGKGAVSKTNSSTIIPDCHLANWEKLTCINDKQARKERKRCLVTMKTKLIGLIFLFTGVHQTKKKIIKTKTNERKSFFLIGLFVVFLREIVVQSNSDLGLILKKQLFEPFKGYFVVFQELPPEI
jgi:hypothetical protein